MCVHALPWCGPHGTGLDHTAADELHRMSPSKLGQLQLATSYAIELAGTGLTYLLLAKFGLMLASMNPSASPVWPPTGFALAMVLLRGHRVWPALFIAAFVANATTAGSLATSIGIALGNTLEALVGAHLIKRWCGGMRAFDTPANVAKFAVISIGPAALISATMGVTALRMGGYVEATQLGAVWMTWWVGDAASALLLAPVIVLWAVAGPRAFGRRELAKTAILLAAAAAVGLVVFSPLAPITAGKAPMSFLAVVPLLWAALHRGPRDTATVALLLACVAVWGAAADHGPFAGSALNDSLLLVSTFVIGAALPSLALSAEVERRRQAEQTALRLAAIVASSSDAILGKTLDGSITSWNEGAERLLGYPASEMLGRSGRCLIPASRQSEEDDSLASIATGEHVSQYETVRLHKDGRAIDVSVTISPIRDPDGRVSGASSIVRDITERKRHEEQIELLLREVNHRAKNLLGLVQAIASQTTAPDRDDFIARFKERLQALAASQDLLVQSQWRGVDMADLVRSQLAHFNDLMGDRITVEGPPVRVSAGAAQVLSMALHELLTNAAKYGALSNDAGRVKVTWGMSEDRAGGKRFQLGWVESGGPPVTAPARHGFGTTLVEQIPHVQLEADVAHDYTPAGVSWRLICPLEKILEPPID
jgi:PAS domain S-box-containing protein